MAIWGWTCPAGTAQPFRYEWWGAAVMRSQGTAGVQSRGPYRLQPKAPETYSSVCRTEGFENIFWVASYSMSLPR